MSTRLKSSLLLIATLLIGGLLGALINARFAEERLEQIAFLRGPGGFSRTMERAIIPVDDSQRDAIRAILKTAESRVREQTAKNRLDMGAIIDSTNQQLRSILTPDQFERLERRLEFRRPDRRRSDRQRRRKPTGR